MQNLIKILLCAWLLWSQSFVMQCTKDGCTTGVSAGPVRLVETHETLQDCKTAMTTATDAIKTEHDKHEQPDWVGIEPTVRCLPAELGQPTPLMLQTR